MGMTLQEQMLKLVPSRTYTTIRTRVEVTDFDKVAALLDRWWIDKTEPRNSNIPKVPETFKWTSGSFKVDYLKEPRVYALVLEEADSTIDMRIWSIEVAMGYEGDKLFLDLRSSYCQPPAEARHPDMRAPNFLRKIVEENLAVDVMPLLAVPFLVSDGEGLWLFKKLLESPDRMLPVIAISADDSSNPTQIVNHKDLSYVLAGVAHVVLLTFRQSWELSSAWTNEWSVFNGAVRCYAPGFDRTRSKLLHRLWMPEQIRNRDAERRDGFKNVCVNHVFTAATAQSEPLPLETPAKLKSIRAAAAKDAALKAGRLAMPKAGSFVIAKPYVAVENAHRPVEIVPVKQTEVEAPVVLAPVVMVPEAAIQLAEEKRLLLLANEEKDEMIRLLDEERASLVLKEANEREARARAEQALNMANENVQMHVEEIDRLEHEKAIREGRDQEGISETLRPLFGTVSALMENMRTVSTTVLRLEKADVENVMLTAKLAERDARISVLTSQTEQRTITQNCIPPALRDLIAQSGLIGKELSLRDSLTLLETLFPERIVVLESAYKSAEASSHFVKNKTASRLLWIFATQYWEALREKGDAHAHKVFSVDAYAAQDSVKTAHGHDIRTFTYNGVEYEMQKHLRLGTARNAAECLRVHFEWFAKEEKLVIGHCGKHLDF